MVTSTRSGLTAPELSPAHAEPGTYTPRCGGASRNGDVFVSTLAHKGHFTYAFEASVPVRSDLVAEFRRETAFTQLEKWLGARELVVGDRGFDARFDIHASDREVLRRARSPAVDPCGGCGEFYTCVVDGPRFRRPVAARRGIVVERDGFVFADVVPEGKC